jgi:hypothetical protein
MPPPLVPPLRRAHYQWITIVVCENAGTKAHPGSIALDAHQTNADGYENNDFPQPKH